jgi:hypothetical protein
MVRTGIVAMGRGMRIQDTQYEPAAKTTKSNGYQRFSV